MFRQQEAPTDRVVSSVRVLKSGVTAPILPARPAVLRLSVGRPGFILLWGIPDSAEDRLAGDGGHPCQIVCCTRNLIGTGWNSVSDLLVPSFRPLLFRLLHLFRFPIRVH